MYLLKKWFKKSKKFVKKIRQKKISSKKFEKIFRQKNSSKKIRQKKISSKKFVKILVKTVVKTFVKQGHQCNNKSYVIYISVHDLSS